jgi:hypothetical protein
VFAEYAGSYVVAADLKIHGYGSAKRESTGCITVFQLAY